MSDGGFNIEWFLYFYVAYLFGLFAYLDFGQMLKTPPPPPNQALSNTLFRHDNATLRKIMWFCCKVWFFDYENYLNIIKIVPPLAPKSMLVDSTMFYVWEVQILNLLDDNITKN